MVKMYGEKYVYARFERGKSDINRHKACLYTTTTTTINTVIIILSRQTAIKLAS